MDMKKIKLSPFWLGMLASVVVLVIILASLIAPKAAALTKKQGAVRRAAKELEAARAETPSRGDIESWQKYRAEVTASYNLITKFYADSDKYLERWFPGILLGADGDPARDNFMAKYKDEGDHLEAKLQAKPFEVKIGVDDESGGGGKKAKYGFNWEAITPDMWAQIAGNGPNDEKAVLRELQKRYWARQRLANIILNNSVKVNRIVDFRFFKRLHEKLGNAPWEQWNYKQDEVIHWQGVNAGQNGQPIGFMETDLPNELGKTLTFGFAVELPYSEVPKAIREMLNPGNEAAAQERMLINLIGTSVSIRDQNEPEIKFTFEKGNKQDEDTKRAEALAKAGGGGPRPVLLAVTCQIIDFDPSKIKKFDKAQ